MTMKEWVAQVLESNEYLKDFPAQNGNKIQLLDKDKIMDILEYRVPALWHREVTRQGFDSMDQGLNFFVEFCTRLELCEPSADKPKDKKSPKPKNTGKRKADVPTKPAGEKKFYCDLHGCNKTHDTEDCYKLKQHAKCAKQGKECKNKDNVTYKDINVFVNAKVTAALKKAKKSLKKERKDKQVKLNAFDKFRTLNIDKSSDNKDEHDMHVSIDVDNGSNSDSK
eukprot:15330145-Ditylum_brightwellii.AAC.1